MKTQLIVGIVTAIAMLFVAIRFVYPAVFTFIKGLFEGGDLGTIAALGVCVLVTVPLIWAVVGITFGLVFLSAYVQDKIEAKQRRNRRLSR